MPPPSLDFPPRKPKGYHSKRKLANLQSVFFCNTEIGSLAMSAINISISNSISRRKVGESYYQRRKKTLGRLCPSAANKISNGGEISFFFSFLFLDLATVHGLTPMIRRWQWPGAPENAKGPQIKARNDCATIGQKGI